jgi:glycerophosphoryl diester phosphodiesterase
MDRLNSVLLSSFLIKNLTHARRLMPSVRTGFLAPGFLAVPRLFTSRHAAYDAFHPYKSDVSPWLVKHVHQRKRQLFVYTVNRPDEMRRLAGLGVDGIFTDDPVLAFQILGVRP